MGAGARCNIQLGNILLRGEFGKELLEDGFDGIVLRCRERKGSVDPSRESRDPNTSFALLSEYVP